MSSCSHDSVCLLSVVLSVNVRPRVSCAAMPEPFLRCFNPAGLAVDQLCNRPAQDVRVGSLNEACGGAIQNLCCHSNHDAANTVGASSIQHHDFAHDLAREDRK